MRAVGFSEFQRFKDGKPLSPTSTWYLATTENLVRFYQFDAADMRLDVIPYELIDQLDLGALTGATDKKSAGELAKKLGLKNWRYVRV